MAVSKIAVMALVGILAIPILLGYAFNLSEVSVTDYKPEGDQVNVTDYLRDSVGYNYVSGNYYKLNTDFSAAAPGEIGSRIMPVYERLTSTKSPLFMSQWLNGGNPPTHYLPDMLKYGLLVGGFDNDNYISLTLTLNDNSTTVMDRISTVFYEDSTKIMECSFYENGAIIIYKFTAPLIVNYAIHGNYSGQWLEQWQFISDNTDTINSWVDFSSGFHFYGKNGMPYHINLPNHSKSALISINLDSVTVPNYSISINGFMLEKTTTAEGVSWKVVSNTDPTDIRDLYYDPSIINNTYQIYFDTTMTHKSPEESSPGVYMDYYHYKDITQFRYIGGWQDRIGVANTYLQYDFTSEERYSLVDGGLDSITVVSDSAENTPILRVDYAVYRGMEYPIISDRIYNPAQFKTNPSTTINNISQYGYAIEFGGNTYIVDSSGNITLGTHKVSVDGLKLESIPVPVGYENRINGNVVSVSSTPSDIKFSGQWVASVSTIGNIATTYNKTQWTPGVFGWDGIDTNFLIVGLISCLGVFIALGIYARKTGKGVIPLMIVCGGAAALFICMI